MFRIAWREKPWWTERVSSFSFEDRVNKASLATFTCRNDDYAMLDLAAFKERTVEFSFGRPGRMSRWVKADIKSMKNPRTLELTYAASEMRLMAKKRTRLFLDTTLMAIVDEVAAGVDLMVDGDEALAEITVNSASQAGETDAQFLSRLAGAYGYHWWIDGDVLRFVGYDRDEPKVLRYSQLIEEPDFEYDVHKMRTKVKTKDLKQTGADYDERDVDEAATSYGGAFLSEVKKSEYLGEWDAALAKYESENHVQVHHDDYTTTYQQGSGAVKADGGPKQEDEEEVVGSVGKARELKEKRIIKIGLAIVGDAGWRAGDQFLLEGAPDVIGGQWFIHTARHSWEGGYTTRIEAKKHGTKKKVDKAAQKKEGGYESKKYVPDVNVSSEYYNPFMDMNDRSSGRMYHEAEGIDTSPKSSVTINEDYTTSWTKVGGK